MLVVYFIESHEIQREAAETVALWAVCLVQSGTGLNLCSCLMSYDNGDYTFSWMGLPNMISGCKCTIYEKLFRLTICGLKGTTYQKHSDKKP